ncbi:unannotated protein [freshwater metagenome]|uniref:Unannotated protein n=1 Tax=freshwater metagenome TaxID=449393 RepID=A0A6J6QD88_9ZZZZ
MGALCLLAMVGIVTVTHHTPPQGTPYVAAEPWKGALWVFVIGAVAAWVTALGIVARRRELLRVVIGIAVCIQAAPLSVVALSDVLTSALNA